MIDLDLTSVDWQSLTTDELDDVLRAVSDIHNASCQHHAFVAVHRSRYIDWLIAMTFTALAGLGVMSAINALIWLSGSLLILACVTGFISSMLAERLEESRLEFSKMTDELTARRPRNDFGEGCGDAT